MAQISEPDNDGEAALATLRAMVAIAEATVEQATGRLTLTQFRALRVVCARTPITMGRVAEELVTNPSTITRACDRLAALELLHKAQNPLNRRETLLAPTAKGRQLVERVHEERRRMLAAVLGRLEPDARAATVDAFARFADAASALPMLPATVALSK